MTTRIDEGKLTAWERWELADLDSTARKPAAKQDKPQPQPEVALPTAEDIERIKQQAQQQGHQAGYKEGQAKARGEAERLARAAGKLEAALRELDNGVADELLALALEVARQVVRHEIGARPEVLIEVVHEALGQLPHQHAAIYLHPEDASLVRSYLGDQLAHAGHRIHEDPKLARGDCILDAGGSTLDASVATRWRRVLESLGLDLAWNVPKAP
ncbi:MAG: flagellar assembly protein FliH [Rhodocyclales bacterium]|nr:flagellar assembly protein FliH [Rhodocyclales bacterium]